MSHCPQHRDVPSFNVLEIAVFTTRVITVSILRRLHLNKLLFTCYNKSVMSIAGQTPMRRHCLSLQSHMHVLREKFFLSSLYTRFTLSCSPRSIQREIIANRVIKCYTYNSTGRDGSRQL